MRKVQKMAYDEIVRLLKDEPEGWTFDKHTAEYRDLKIEVWMSNRYYGTKFSYGSIHSGQDVNIFWMFKPWEWWRVKLVSEVEKAQARQMGLIV